MFHGSYKLHGETLCVLLIVRGSLYHTSIVKGIVALMDWPIMVSLFRTLDGGILFGVLLDVLSIQVGSVSLVLDSVTFNFEV